MPNLNEILLSLIEQLKKSAPSFLLAITVIIVGFWVIKKIVKMLGTVMEKSNLDNNIQPFLKTLIGTILKVLLIFSAVSLIGIETTSFVAVLAAAGFAVGMALQGSLSNFASGIMVLLFKPYKLGDLIEVEDEIGHVKEIQIFNTILETMDMVTVIIPNSNAISGKIKNFTSIGHRRVDLNIYMPYEESFPKVRDLILEALQNTDKVLKDPAPFVGIENNDTHSIILAVRPYANTEDYWDVYFNSYQNIKAKLHENHVKVAYSEGIELGAIGK